MDNDKSTHVVAKSHTPEYLIHKYWSRKPHNILREIFLELLDERAGVVIDPFCGSGVSLVEAARLGADTYGADLNPVAALLSKVSVAPPCPDSLSEALEEILAEFTSVFGPRYVLHNGKNVRYVVHAIQVKCEGCGLIVTSEDCKKSGRTYSCKHCGSRARFNLERWIASRVIQIKTATGEVIRRDDNQINRNVCEEEERRAGFEGLIPEAVRDKYDARMLLNRRVLTFPGMKVSNLFTPRAFSAACWLFERVSKLARGPTQEACYLFLTSCLAQFSRLILFRNDLTTGGPAWSVPGFWVAPIHLETNPLVHLRARSRKFLKGIRKLHKSFAGSDRRASVVCRDASEFMNELKRRGIRADLIFLDPPYGDSVPYLEFSAIWNSFLRQPVRYEQEIVISDRMEQPSGWENYEGRLTKVVRLCSDVLTDKGAVVVTFNNLNLRTWYAILGGTREAGFWCRRVHYQVPAVVSAKAQFSPRNSYAGDFYCVFSRDRPPKQEESPSELIRIAVTKVIRSRRPPVPYPVVQRAALLTILRENLEPEIVLHLDELLSSFSVRINHGIQLLPAQSEFATLDVPLLEEVVRQVAVQSLKDRSLRWDEFFGKILDATEDLGVPSEQEARSWLADMVEFREACFLKESHATQGLLFT